MLAIPDDPFEGAAVSAAVGNDLAEAIDVVEAVRRATVSMLSSNAGASAPGTSWRMNRQSRLKLSVVRGERGGA